MIYSGQIIKGAVIGMLERNWGGNYRYHSIGLYAPETVEQAQELVAAGQVVKSLGSRHSFNGLADTEGVHLSLERLNRVLWLDKERGKVTVEGGIRYGELGSYLHKHGYALRNLASLPHISVAGACATATHGSGDRNGSLATEVDALEIIKSDGELISLSREEHPDTFPGAVVNVGALGIVTKLTLNVVPAYEVSQTVYEGLPLAKLEDSLDAIFAGGYSVSLFTDWQDSLFNQVWLKRQHAEDVSYPSHYFGAKASAVKLHPVPGFASINCSEQLSVPGPWHERLPHFRMDFTPSAGEELQSEYFVAREHAYEALCALDRLRARISPLLYVSEVRTVAADDLWLSPYRGQATIGIHFTWKPVWDEVRQVLPLIEESLERWSARPHWGKLFTMGPEHLQPLYEKLGDFRSLAERFDPEGKFHNSFLERYVLNRA